MPALEIDLHTASGTRVVDDLLRRLQDVSRRYGWAAGSLNSEAIAIEVLAWLTAMGLDPFEHPVLLRQQLLRINLERLADPEPLPAGALPRPGDRVRLVVESTVAAVEGYTASSPHPQIGHGPGGTVYYGAELVPGGYMVELPDGDEATAGTHTRVQLQVLPGPDQSKT